MNVYAWGLRIQVGSFRIGVAGVLADREFQDQCTVVSSSPGLSEM